MVGGFALADLSLQGGTNSVSQGSQTTTVSSVTGLTYVSTNLSELGGTTSVTNPCTLPGVPCNAHSSGWTVCVGGFTGSTGCAAGDFVEQVNLSVSTSTNFPAGTVALTVYVTGAPFGGTASTFTGTTSYFNEPLGHPTAPEFIVLDFDTGTPPNGPGAVKSVSVIATT
jgi:hypothetical protein